MDDEKRDKSDEIAPPRELTGRERSLAAIAPHKFQKGQINNPAGRPKGLARQIREETDNLKEQIKNMIAISLGKVPRATVRDMVEATKWLADRSNGRALETVLQGELGDEAMRNVTEELSDTDLEDLLRKLKSAG